MAAFFLSPLVRSAAFRPAAAIYFVNTCEKVLFRKIPLSFSWNVWYNRYKRRWARRKGNIRIMESNALLNAKLSLDSDISLYAQLVGIIKQNISSGELNVGDLLPSEAELCRTMGISRNTVRQAIGELEEEGLVVRKRGKGTFVADPNARGKCVRYSFTTEISSMGKVPSSTMVDFGIIVPPPEISRKMQLQEGVTVYCFTRVRNVDGEPLILETSYYPQYPVSYTHLTLPTTSRV